MTHFSARGLAAGYARGRQHIQKLNTDRARFEFLLNLWQAWRFNGLALPVVEAAFVCRLLAEVNEEAPDIFCGDANICDSLRRKYLSQLESLEPAWANIAAKN
jgi:hypothetical protein